MNSGLSCATGNLKAQGKLQGCTVNSVNLELDRLHLAH